jgi:hypothetical protein
MMRGHYPYYGITGNIRRLKWYAHRAQEIWYFWLRRRSRGKRGGYRLLADLLQRHPLPNGSFTATPP